MRRGLWSIAVAGAVIVAHPAAAKDALPLEPSSQWVLNYDDDSCALRRTFKDGEDLTYLELRRFAPGTSLQTMVASSRMKARNPADIRYRFGDEGEWDDLRALTLNMDGELKSGVLFESSIASPSALQSEGDMRGAPPDWRSIEHAAVGGVRTFALRGAFSKQMNLQLGPMTAPIDALNDCIDELMTHWGIDVEAHKTLTRQATPIDMQAAARMVGYPPKMVARSMPGLVNVRLAIDEEGQITGCHIQMPLSDPDFEESSCADIQHAFEFSPALDKDGKPIPSYWVTKVVFQIGY
jgi:hypothetical protein